MVVGKSVTAWNELLDRVTSDIGKKDYAGAVLITRTAFPNARIYSNGLDLAWLLQEKDVAFVAGAFLPLLKRMISLPVPTVACVSGHAFAGGFLFAMCHDFRIMRQDKSVP